MSQSQKCPRAETQSHHSPQHKRARVEESERFTLFDKADVLDMDITLFDGQLSDLTEVLDGGSEFPPLMRPGSESELGLDKKQTEVNRVPSGDWEGV
jgi:hypothetical protein